MSVEVEDVWQELIYLPQWCDRMPGGEWGPLYGPTSMGSYTAAWERWYESTDGGGLWDQAEYERTIRGNASVTPSERKRAPRSGWLEMERYVLVNHDRLPHRELQVWACMYQHSWTVARAAVAMGVERGTIKALWQRLRCRVGKDATFVTQSASL